LATLNHTNESAQKIIERTRAAYGLPFMGNNK